MLNWIITPLNYPLKCPSTEPYSMLDCQFLWVFRRPNLKQNGYECAPQILIRAVRIVRQKLVTLLNIKCFLLKNMGGIIRAKCGEQNDWFQYCVFEMSWNLCSKKVCLIEKTKYRCALKCAGNGAISVLPKIHFANLFTKQTRLAILRKVCGKERMSLVRRKMPVKYQEPSVIKTICQSLEK